MDTDQEILEELYGTFRVDSDLTEEVLDNLTDRYISGYPFIEKFHVYDVQPIAADEKIADGILDVYYNVILKEPYQVRVYMKKTQLVIDEFKSPSNKNMLSDLLDPDSTCLTFKFLDKNNKLQINGAMGVNAKFVLDFVISCVMNTLSRNNRKISAMYYVVFDDELKRIKLYDKIMGIFLKNKRRYAFKEGNKTYVFFI